MRSFEGGLRVTNVRVKRVRLLRPSQGDIFRDVECIEHVVQKRGVVEVSKIIYPLVVILTQDCDLEQHSRYQTSSPPSNHDKLLLSVLVAPLYNAEHVFNGTHLQDLGMTMTRINKDKTEGKTLQQNERPRYHYLNFPKDVAVVPMVVDFKHFFSVNAKYLQKIRHKHFVCRLSDLFREDLSQRFAGYLARIGLPTLPKSE